MGWYRRLVFCFSILSNPKIVAADSWWSESGGLLVGGTQFREGLQTFVRLTTDKYGMRKSHKWRCLNSNDRNWRTARFSAIVSSEQRFTKEESACVTDSPRIASYRLRFSRSIIPSSLTIQSSGECLHSVFASTSVFRYRYYTGSYFVTTCPISPIQPS